MTSSKTILYVIIAIVVIIAIWLIWYYYPAAPYVPGQPSSSLQLSPLSGGNTTSDISKDLNSIPDDSAALQQEQNNLNQSINSF